MKKFQEFITEASVKHTNLNDWEAHAKKEGYTVDKGGDSWESTAYHPVTKDKVGTFKMRDRAKSTGQGFIRVGVK